MKLGFRLPNPLCPEHVCSVMYSDRTNRNTDQIVQSPHPGIHVTTTYGIFDYYLLTSSNPIELFPPLLIA